MKVLLDYWVFDTYSMGGVYQYYIHLLEEALKNEDINYTIGCIFRESKTEAITSDKYAKLFSKNKNISINKSGKRLSELINIIYSLYKIKLSKYDVLHPTYYSLYVPSILNMIKQPMAITVYDMIHELFPQHILRKNQTPLKKKLLCEKAKIIFAISESTKNDIVSQLKINPDKIKVTHLSGGFSNYLYPNILFESTLPSKYILFVGARATYKNFNIFFKAMIPLMKKDPELNVICTGPPFSEQEIELFTKYNLNTKFKHIFVNKNEFYSLYKNALVFVFPSLYEGFGIPIIEAFQSECPAILSKTKCLEEVGGEAAIYFDPESEIELRNEIEKVIYNTSLRTQLISSGLKRAENFTWTKTANATFEGYKSII